MTDNLDVDIDILARTIYGEARGEGVEGMEAVACVVMNRYKSHKWFCGYTIQDGNKIPSVAQTCLKKFQFICWNKNDPNLRKIKNVTPEDKIFKHCLKIARSAVCGNLKDFTGGAVYYHTKNIKPKWADGKIPCYEVKNHLFYKEDKND